MGGSRIGACGLQIRVVTVDPVSWTAVVAPFDCSGLLLKNRDGVNSLKLRSDASDPATEEMLGPGMQQAIAVPFGRYRFAAGSDLMYLQSTAGTGPAVLMFLA